MATELSGEELEQLASVAPGKYSIQRAMSPFWKNFLLDDHDHAKIDLAETNATGLDSAYLNLISRITGVESPQIGSFILDEDVITIVPYDPTDIKGVIK